MSAACALRDRGDVTVWSLLGHRCGNRSGEHLDVVPGGLPFDGDYDVKPLPSGSLDEALQAKCNEPVANITGSFDDRRPRDIFARVEIKDQTIRLFQMIDGRSPRVDFDNARLHKAHESRQPIDCDHRLFVSGIDLTDAGIQPLPRMLGEKALASCARGASQQTQRTAGDMGKNPVGDVGVEFGQPLFGDSLLFPKNPFRMGQVDANAI